MVLDPVSVYFHGKIVGVVQDFHYESLRNSIEPLVLYLLDPSAQWPRSISMRIQSQNLTHTLSQLKNLYASHFPATTFDTFFINDEFGRLYEQEKRVVEVLGYVSALSILIACLGLLGLVMFVLTQKRREIGIRRVFGASVNSLMLLFSQGYLKCILISMIIACPIAYMGIHLWLRGFAYRTNIGVAPALFAGGIVLVLAFITIAIQVHRAGRVNPVETLRCE